MASFEHVTVIVDGYELTGEFGFQQVEIGFAMKNAAIPFMLEATWPSYSAPALKLRGGDQIEIRTQFLAEGQPPTPGGGDLLLIGAVDDYEADIGEGGHKTVKLNGRSNARDVVDCPPVDHPTGQVRNMNLVDAANALGAEFAVKWFSDLGDLATIAKIQVNPGEPLHRTIERHARMQGLMLVGQPDGSIKVTRAGTQRHPGALSEGQPPVIRWSVRISPKSQRSAIVTRGQRANSTNPADLRQEYRYTPANAPARHRPAAVYLEGDRANAGLATRGQWHHLRSFGFGMQVAPLVSSWRDSGGALWNPGNLMAIALPSEQIDMDMTLSEAKLKQDIGSNNGTRAELVFVDPRTHGGKAPMGATEPDDFNPDDDIN